MLFFCHPFIVTGPIPHIFSSMHPAVRWVGRVTLNLNVRLLNILSSRLTDEFRSSVRNSRAYSSSLIVYGPWSAEKAERQGSCLLSTNTYMYAADQTNRHTDSALISTVPFAISPEFEQQHMLSLDHTLLIIAQQFPCQFHRQNLMNQSNIRRNIAITASHFSTDTSSKFKNRKVNQHVEKHSISWTSSMTCSSLQCTVLWLVDKYRISQ